MDVNKLNECPDCASTNIVHETFRDQIICRECGLIFEPLVPQLQEQFERARKGLPPKPKATPKPAKVAKTAQKKAAKKAKKAVKKAKKVKPKRKPAKKAKKPARKKKR